MLKKICLALFLLLCETSYAGNVDIPITVDSRIKTIIYNPNEIYTMDLKMGFQSIVEFSIDENIELISIGDPYPWKLTPIDRRLFIKPLQVGARTNLTVITNKRTYLFELVSDSLTSSNDQDVIHVARFFYPQTPLDKSKYTFDDYLSQKGGSVTQNALEADGLTGQAIGNTNLTSAADQGIKRVAINLSYSFVGEYNEVTPIEIFDDRKDTYFRFKSNETPPKIYSISVLGRRKLLKQKQVGDFVIVQGVHTKFHLKQGVYENYIYNDLKVNKQDE